MRGAVAGALAGFIGALARAGYAHATRIRVSQTRPRVARIRRTRQSQLVALAKGAGLGAAYGQLRAGLRQQPPWPMAGMVYGAVMFALGATRPEAGSRALHREIVFGAVLALVYELLQGATEMTGEANAEQRPEAERATRWEDAEAQLRARYAALWQDVQREMEKHEVQSSGDLMARRGDLEDRSIADLLIDLNLAEIDRDVREMRSIQRAIARIKQGTYGFCEVCGEPIPPARLEALPEATLCLEHQQRSERFVAASPSL